MAGVTLNYNASTGPPQVSNSANREASLSFQSSSLASGIFHDTWDGATGILVSFPRYERRMTSPVEAPSVFANLRNEVLATFPAQKYVS